MIIYPVKDYDDLMDESTTSYPITTRRFWHNGVHFTSDGATVSNIHAGRVVAMRLTENCEYNDTNKIPENIISILTDHDEYFDHDNGFCTIKEIGQNGITKEEHENAMIIVGAAFSNNFVLVKHSANNLYGEPIEFYSLAMHLRPLNRLNFIEKIATCWYETKITISSPTYDYVSVSNVNGNGGDGEIPCETVIKVLETSDITWTLNGETEITTIEKSKYRKVGDAYEIKRPGDDTAKNLAKGEYFTKSGLLVYAEKDQLKRTVTHLLDPLPHLTYISDDQTFFETDYENNTGILVSFKLEGNLEEQSGYIYPRFEDDMHKFLTTGKFGVYEPNSVKLGNITFTLSGNENTDIKGTDDQSFVEKLKTGLYTILVTVDPSKFNYVEAYNVEGIKEILPCETPIEVLPSVASEKAKIQWTLNGTTQTCFLETSKYRFDLLEIKRPARTEGERNSTNYLQKEEVATYGSRGGLVVYTTGNNNKKGVKYLLDPVTNITPIDKTLATYNIEKTGILVSFSLDGSTTESGYIYPEFRDDVTDRLLSYTADSEAITTKIDAFNANIKIAKKPVTLENLTFTEPELKAGITTSATPEDIIIPENTENFDVKTGDIIGHCGYGICTDHENSCAAIGRHNHLKLPLHYEIFCPNVDFMEANEGEDFPYRYKIIGSFTCYEGEPKTYTVPLYADMRRFSTTPVFSLIPADVTNMYLKIVDKKRCIDGNLFYRVSIQASIATSDYRIRATVELTEKPDKSGRYIYCANASNDEEIFSLRESQNSFYNILFSEEKLHKDFYYWLEKDTQWLDEKIPWLDEIPYWTDENRTVYKITYMYTTTTNSDFWVRAIDLKEVTIKLSDSDYLLTKTLTKAKILDGFDITNDTKIENPLKNGSFEKTSYLEGWNEKTGKIESWQKIKYTSVDGKSTTYWIDSKSLETSLSNKNIEKVSYHNWYEFFHEVGSDRKAHLPTDPKPTDLSKLFNEDDEAVGKTFIEKMDSTENKTELSDYIKYCAALKKVVYKHSPEWTEDPDYVTTFTKGYSNKNRERVKAQQKALAFDASGVPLENWYFHPISFINHLNKLVFSNPYEGKVLIARNATGNDDKQIEVKSCFGFAPVYTKLDGTKFPAYLRDATNPNRYWAGLSYVFGYSEAYCKDKENHRGIDLGGNERDPIVSMIRGKVWATTWNGKVINDRTLVPPDKGTGWGKVMIIKDMNNDLLYLLAHLYAYNKEEGADVYPGETVAFVGNTGNSDGAHLHLEVSVCEAKNKDSVLAKDANSLNSPLAWNTDLFDYKANRRNPLDHSEKSPADKE